MVWSTFVLARVELPGGVRRLARAEPQGSVFKVDMRSALNLVVAVQWWGTVQLHFMLPLGQRSLAFFFFFFFFFLCHKRTPLLAFVGPQFFIFFFFFATNARGVRWPIFFF